MQLFVAPVLAALALIPSAIDLDTPLQAPSADAAPVAMSVLGSPPDTPDTLDPCSYGRLHLASLKAAIKASKEAAPAASKALATAQAQHQQLPSAETRTALIQAEEDLKHELRTLNSLTMGKLQLIHFLEAFCEQDLK